MTAASHYPDRFPFSAGTIRVAPVNRFPYCVYYRIRGGMVVILAVYHQSRDPDGWKSRR